MNTGSRIWSVCLPILLCTIGCGGGGECETSAYPARPDGVTGTVYVSAGCPPDEADGSAAHPYPTLGQAVAAAKVDHAVLVAPGTYAENLTIDKRLSVIGTTGSDRGETAGIILQAPDPSAITILGARNVFLKGFRVVGAKDVGIVVRGGSLKVDSVSISDTVAVNEGLGYGVVVRDSGSIILQNSTVVRSHSIGVLIFGSHGIILQSTISDNDGGGVRVDRSDGESIVQDSFLGNNAVFAVGVVGAKASILHNEIARVRMGAGDMADIGDGIVAFGVEDEVFGTMVASVTVEDNTVADAARVGALFAAETHQIILQNNRIQGSAKEANFGAGIWMQEGAGGDQKGNRIAQNEIKDNRFVGIGMTSPTREPDEPDVPPPTSAGIQDNLVSGTVLGATTSKTEIMEIGDGIGVFNARAQITGNRVNSCARIGIVLDAVDGATVMTNNRIERNDVGVIQQNQPELDVDNNTIQLNTSLDKRVVGAGEAPVPVRADNFKIQGAR
jgi:hypothetical protein